LEKHVREQSSALGQWHSRSRPEQVGTVIQAGANKITRQLDLLAYFDSALVDLGSCLDVRVLILLLDLLAQLAKPLEYSVALAVASTALLLIIC
jgi:hypothetical protein